MFSRSIYYVHALILVWVLFPLLGCKKFVAVDPPVTGLIGSVTYSKNETAAAAVNSIFQNTLSANFTHGAGGVTTMTGLAADELNTNPNSSTVYLQYYKNNILPATTGAWPLLYARIFQCNEAIEGLSGSKTLSEALKNQLLGEAKFMRAFYYFYLVNLYSDVPLILTSDYKINKLLPRTPAIKIWDQIVTDLVEAKSLLPLNYYSPLGTGTYSERVLPVKAAAAAMLSRVYLYREEWANAVNEATFVINDPKYVLNNNLSQVFLKNSSESILQLGAISPATSTISYDGNLFVILTAPTASNYPVSISQGLYDSFDTGDKRKTEWIGTFTGSTGTYRYAYKYKTSRSAGQAYTEYLMLLRLAESYLIRAEANAQQNKLSESADDLNKIRKRSGLSATSATDKPSLLSEIMLENRREFFCEWGHRWFDLKRTKSIDQVMSTVATLKNSVWKTDAQLFPIPEPELILNPNLVQNKGY